jgi:hypothetical protein
MARGYAALHESTEALLAELGIPDEAVSQGWGTAVAASAGFHNPEGKSPGGRRYSSCFDLRWPALTKDLRDKLVAAGVCVFPRDWPGNQHHHCVQVGLRTKGGRCAILPGPRVQIRDFIACRTGLVGHRPWVGRWEPTAHERSAILAAYTDWVPDVATQVRVATHGVPCYAWLEGPKTRRVVTCEVRALVEGLGGRVIAGGLNDVGLRAANGRNVIVTVYPDAYLAGEFLRAPVRPIAEALGYAVGFGWAVDKASCMVRLTALEAE